MRAPFLIFAVFSLFLLARFADCMECARTTSKCGRQHYAEDLVLFERTPMESDPRRNLHSGTSTSRDKGKKKVTFAVDEVSPEEWLSNDDQDDIDDQKYMKDISQERRKYYQTGYDIPPNEYFEAKLNKYLHLLHSARDIRNHKACRHYRSRCDLYVNILKALRDPNEENLSKMVTYYANKALETRNTKQAVIQRKWKRKAKKADNWKNQLIGLRAHNQRLSESNVDAITELQGRDLDDGDAREDTREEHSASRNTIDSNDDRILSQFCSYEIVPPRRYFELKYNKYSQKEHEAQLARNRKEYEAESRRVDHYEKILEAIDASNSRYTRPIMEYYNRKYRESINSEDATVRLRASRSHKKYLAWKQLLLQQLASECNEWELP